MRDARVRVCVRVCVRLRRDTSEHRRENPSTLVSSTCEPARVTYTMALAYEGITYYQEISIYTPTSMLRLSIDVPSTCLTSNIRRAQRRSIDDTPTCVLTCVSKRAWVCACACAREGEKSPCPRVIYILAAVYAKFFRNFNSPPTVSERTPTRAIIESSFSCTQTHVIR